jgi:chemotaxis protein methyltransferase WspC
VSTGVIETVVRERLGLDPAALGPNVIDRAVDARMHARRITDASVYAARLMTEAAERDSLASELAVSETWFFRGGRALFDRLAAFVADRAAGRAARVLSAPCSTGEEPYSLAIALHERFLAPSGFAIDAVDLSERALAKAAAARYGPFAFREAGTDLRPVYFRRAEDAWELLPHLRSAVRFLPANLTEPTFLAGERPYDLILCRNLFIYLTADARLRAMANIDRLLALEGRLCITPAEADRLPPGRFVQDGPTEFGLYRRAGAGSDIHRPLPAEATTPPPAPLAEKRDARSEVNASPPTRSAARSDLPLRGGGQTALTSPPEGEIAVQRRVGGEAQASESTPAKPGTLEAARSLADAGQLDEARAVCEQLVRARPSDADPLALLGVIHLAAARESQAFDAFRRALYLAPDHVEAMSHMAGLCERRGEKAHAAALRRRLARVAKEGA